MEIEQDVDSNSSHQKAVLSSTVVIAGPSSLDLATNISIVLNYGYFLTAKARFELRRN